IAVAFVTWMIFWMARNARQLKGELQTKVDSAAAVAPWAVALMAFLAVAREGLETALFLWSAARASGGGPVPLFGAALGLGTAVVLGWLIYRGALRLNLARFFMWTGAALVIVAGGVLAYGIHDLQEAGILPGLNTLAFDVSRAVPPTSWYGALLKGTVNFSPATTVLQAVAWVAYVVPVMWLFLRTVHRPLPPRANAPQTPAVASTGEAR
ncbi:MAG TPA: FTR1 family protein, partial [Actinomycetota bacterium]|nr:FTR1 family protein [Actinomycetota bacterium]